MSSRDLAARTAAFLRDFTRRGPAKSGRVQILRLVVAVAVAAAIMVFVARVGNPPAHNEGSTGDNATAWNPPQWVGPTDPPPPPGHPRLERPVMIPVPEGEPQSVPTQYGLTYTVPSGDGWRPSNETVVGYSDASGRGTIATYGAVSDYGAHYCPETDTSSLAFVGVRGRNGTDVHTAAREEIEMTPRLFSNPGAREPHVDISPPAEVALDGRPAVRYTASVSDLPQAAGCDPARSEFTVVAVSAPATAEVAVFVIRRHTDLENALGASTVDDIIRSIRKNN